ncbi:MAG: glycosyltransferase family 39 protein, partial [Pseudomonadota bacterium]|nr:glycosyltransferase family 39 protein [Pseudomonadota bacterium]
IYWLQAASAALLGPSDIASYRLPSLAGLIFSLMLVYRFSQSLWPSSVAPVQGLVSILLLASSPLMIAEAHLAKTDSVLLCVILAQQYMLWRIYKDRTAQTGSPPWLGFWLCLSLGILLKGPIAPLVAFTTCAGLVLVDRRGGWLRRLHSLKGLIVTGLVVLPWAVAVTSATDGAFLEIAIIGPTNIVDDAIENIKLGEIEVISIMTDSIVLNNPVIPTL